VIAIQYDARREQDLETGKWKLTCPECGGTSTDDVPSERLHEFFPERYPN
jgi:hypothetical protein